jgi:hypothetical protein
MGLILAVSDAGIVSFMSLQSKEQSHQKQKKAPHAGLIV